MKKKKLTVNYSIRISIYQQNELRRISETYGTNISKIMRYLLNHIIKKSYLWSLEFQNDLDEKELQRLHEIATTKWLED